jgi:uncharacterized delta-60 repeat protein
MKKKHTARSAFFNRCVSLVLSILFAGVLLALLVDASPQEPTRHPDALPRRPNDLALTPSRGVRVASVARYNGPGNDYDEATAIVVDASGNFYVTGASVGSGGDLDYATIKYTSVGRQQWIARYNGPGNSADKAQAIAVDNAGNVYVTGWSYALANSDNVDYATIKYNSAGEQQWVARYDGPGNGFDEATAIAVDESGNVFVTGDSSGSVGNLDYATIKYNSSGEQQWVARYNGPGNFADVATAIAVDTLGNVYVTGYSWGSGNNSDYATIKYNSVGQEQWVARYNGPGNDLDSAYAIALDNSGNVYVTGFSDGSGTDLDYATVKYNSVGQQQWVARYNGPTNGFDEAAALAVDDSGNIYVTGESLNSEANLDYATIKYNSSGEQQWVARYNGPANGNDASHAMAVDGSGNVYVTGSSEGSGTDYATIKYNSAGQEQWVARYNGPGNFDDDAYAIAVDGSGNVYVTGRSIGSGGDFDYATVKYEPIPARPRPTPPSRQ